jgi:hypothetical protein
MTQILSRLHYSDPYLVDLTPQQTRDLWKALVLAPTVEVCEALINAQDVPRSALDPTWAKRFGDK